MTMKRGDVFRHEVAGAGGWGDPLERDPALVLRDVRNEFVSRARGARGLRRGHPGRPARGWTRPRPTALRHEAAQLPAAGPRRPPILNGRPQFVGSRLRPADMQFRVGVDIGGTFTDIVFLGDDGERIYTKKVSSTVDDYARAIVDGLAQVIAERSVGGADIVELLHGTTVASNAILELKGATDRADHHAGLPRRAGDPHAADAAALRHVLDQAAAAGRAAPAHRGGRAGQRAGRRRAAAGRGRASSAPSAFCSARGSRRSPSACCTPTPIPRTSSWSRQIVDATGARTSRCRVSAEVLPEIKEYERTSTTVINAYVRPIVATLSDQPDAPSCGASASRRRCC